MRLGSVCMPKSLLKTWVKNVYTVGIQQGISSEELHTGYSTNSKTTLTYRVQRRFSTHLSNSFTPYFYTPFLRLLNPLITHFYTLSTVPITTKANEK